MKDFCQYSQKKMTSVACLNCQNSLPKIVPNTHTHTHTHTHFTVMVNIMSWLFFFSRMSYDVDIEMKVVGTDQVCQGSYDLKNPCFHNLSPPPVKLSGMAENIFIIWYIYSIFFFRI